MMPANHFSGSATAISRRALIIGIAAAAVAPSAGGARKRLITSLNSSYPTGVAAMADFRTCVWHWIGAIQGGALNPSGPLQFLGVRSMTEREAAWYERYDARYRPHVREHDKWLIEMRFAEA